MTEEYFLFQSTIAVIMLLTEAIVCFMAYYIKRDLYQKVEKRWKEHEN